MALIICCSTSTAQVFLWWRRDQDCAGYRKYAPEVAKAYVAELRDILRSLGVSDVRWEQGSLRCDANVSLRLIGETTLGTRSETKNVNSLRSVERAVRGEMIRHAELLNAGKKAVQRPVTSKRRAD